MLAKFQLLRSVLVKFFFELLEMLLCQCTVGKLVAGQKLLHIINQNTCHSLRVQKKQSKTVVRIGKNVLKIDTKKYNS